MRLPLSWRRATPCERAVSEDVSGPLRHLVHLRSSSGTSSGVAQPYGKTEATSNVIPGVICSFSEATVDFHSPPPRLPPILQILVVALASRRLTRYLGALLPDRTPGRPRRTLATLPRETLMKQTTTRAVLFALVDAVSIPSRPTWSSTLPIPGLSYACRGTCRSGAKRAFQCRHRPARPRGPQSSSLMSGRISPRCLGIGCSTPSWLGGSRHHITRISAAGGFGSSHVKAVRAPAHFEGRKIDPARAQITGLRAPCHDLPGGECLDLETAAGQHVCRV